MFIRPNPASGVPIYLQLVEQVREAVEIGALRPGDPLPDVTPMAEELVVHPAVVARAYRELAAEHVIAWRPDAQARVGDVPVPAASRRTTRNGPAAGLRSSRELARENSRLTAQIAAALADRVARDHELDRAWDVQRRLFPQGSLVADGLDHAGTSRPALGVGGDYYDFIRLSDTEIGIAIGDVSGKGMSAALLMASLRAYLHGLTTQRMTDVAEVMATLNRLVLESSSSNRFASFFYARYDTRTRVLEYVNAGHNPPVIISGGGNRAPALGFGDASAAIVRLATTGPVIGLIPGSSYASQRVQLHEGDLFVLFTDGITEAMTVTGDEWGEERLLDVIAANRDLTPNALVDRIMDACDRFVGDCPQHDDMTVIAVRAVERRDAR